MKVPKTFVPENNERLEEKAKNYLNKVEYVQKLYDEDELGIGATVTLPEEAFKAGDTWGYNPGNTWGVNPWNCSNDKPNLVISKTSKKQKSIHGKNSLGIGAADKPLKYAGLSIEELEKKLLEEYTIIQ